MVLLVGAGPLRREAITHDPFCGRRGEGDRIVGGRRELITATHLQIPDPQHQLVSRRKEPPAAVAQHASDQQRDDPLLGRGQGREAGDQGTNTHGPKEANPGQHQQAIPLGLPELTLDHLQTRLCQRSPFTLDETSESNKLLALTEAVKSTNDPRWRSRAGGDEVVRL